MVNNLAWPGLPPGFPSPPLEVSGAAVGGGEETLAVTTDGVPANVTTSGLNDFAEVHQVTPVAGTYVLSAILGVSNGVAAWNTVTAWLSDNADLGNNSDGVETLSCAAVQLPPNNAVGGGASVGAAVLPPVSVTTDGSKTYYLRMAGNGGACTSMRSINLGPINSGPWSSISLLKVA